LEVEGEGEFPAPSALWNTCGKYRIPGHLGLIAMLVGQKIESDSAGERIIGDTAASKLLSRPYRAPYKL
jgi:hypothetical protein